MTVANDLNPATNPSDNALIPASTAATGNGLATDIEALTGHLTGTQQRYLANLVTSGSVGEAANRAGVKDGTVRSWRARVPGFQEAERLAKDQGGTLSKQIGLAMANSYVGEAVGRLVHEMNHAPHARDRIRAAEAILDRVGVTRESRTASASVHVGLPPGQLQLQVALHYQATGTVRDVLGLGAPADPTSTRGVAGDVIDSNVDSNVGD